MTATWAGVAPQLLLILVVLVVPGLAAARCLRFGWWDSAGLSVPLSLGALAVADELAVRLHVRWGLTPIISASVLIAVFCWVFARWRLRAGTVEREPDVPIEGARWDRRSYVIAGLVTLGAAILGGVAVARGIGTPHSIAQTWDAAFHVNAINAVAQHHSAAPGVVSGVTGPKAGFYPPLFAGVSALATLYGGLNPIVAANLTSVAIAVLWPLTMSIAVRRIARPGVFGYSVAMWGAVTIGIFPGLLLQYGTVWPNALSILCIAPALVLMLRVLGLDRSGDGAADPHGSLALWPSWIALLLTVPGLAFTQPASAFALFYLGMPMLIWLLWRRFLSPSDDLSRRATIGTGVVLGIGVLSIGVIWASYRIASVRSVGNFYWKRAGSVIDAAERVVALHSLQSSGNIAFGLLAVVGIFFALRYARGRFLVVSYAIFAVLYVFAFAIQAHVTMRVTGYWYNDAYRIIGMIPVIALPLAAMAADGIWRFVALGYHRVLPRDGEGQGRGMLAGILAAATIGVCVIAVQGGVGTSLTTRTVALAYENHRQTLVTPGEVAMLERLRNKLPPGATIAGNPFDGEILAGVLSGRPAVYNDFHLFKDADRVLVALRFSDYLSDPGVCAAVQRLRIGVVVVGPPFVDARHQPREPGRHRQAFAGFADVGAVKGLRVIDQGGRATAYALPMGADGRAQCNN